MRIALLLLMLVSLCACSTASIPQKCEPVTEFTCTVQCTQGENAYTFALTSHTDSTFLLEITEPQIMAGVSFVRDAQGLYTVDANGIKDIFTAETFTDQSPVKLLFTALDTLLFTGAKTAEKTQNGNRNVTVSINNQPFNAVFSPDGYLLQFSVADMKYIFQY